MFGNGWFLGGGRATIVGAREGWPSGLRRTLGKRVGVKSVTWVRIPPPPPAYASGFGWQATLWYVYPLRLANGDTYIGSTTTYDEGSVGTSGVMWIRPKPTDP